MSPPINPGEKKMSEAQRIQGPWRVVAHSWSHVSVYAGGRGSECICRLSVNEDEATEETQDALEAQMRARATAIAALPELLHVAAEARRYINKPSDMTGTEVLALFDKLTAAIAKATGAA